MHYIEHALVLTSGSLGDSLSRIPSIKKISKSNKNLRLIILCNQKLNNNIPSAKEILSNLSEIYLIYEYSNKKMDLLLLLLKIKFKFNIKQIYYLMPIRNKYQKIRDFIILKIIGFKINGLILKENNIYEEWKRLLINNNLPTDVTINDFRLINNYSENLYKKFNYLDEFNIVISLGSKTLGQILHYKYWVLILSNLRKHNIKVIFIGGDIDYEFTNLIKNKSQINSINLSGKTTICESSFILSKIGKFVGYDSGPMHLAASSGCQVLSFFSINSGKQWIPFGNEDNIIRLHDLYKNDHYIDNEIIDMICKRILKLIEK